GASSDAPRAGKLDQGQYAKISNEEERRWCIADAPHKLLVVILCVLGDLCGKSLGHHLQAAWVSSLAAASPVLSRTSRISPLSLTSSKRTLTRLDTPDSCIVIP